MADRAQRHALRVEERCDLRGVLQLSRRYEGEFIEEALGVLDDSDHAALDTTDLPAVADREVQGRGHAARHGDFVGSGRVTPRDEREHRTTEGPVRTLRAELIGVDRTGDRLCLVLDELDGTEAVPQTGDDARRVRVVGREGHGVLCGAEAEVRRLRRVDGDGRADDGRRDRSSDEGEDQELLAPLPSEEAPGPPDDGPTGGRSTVGRTDACGWYEGDSAHQGSFGVWCLALKAGFTRRARAR